jgi:hypothetical protein
MGLSFRISTKIFHAIGYRVPEDTIVHFSVAQLRVAEAATLRVASGDKRRSRWRTSRSG